MSKTHPGDLALEHVRMACPSCRCDLRVPRERLGRKLRCLKCEHTFRSQPGDDETLAPPATEIVPRTTTFIEVPCPSCRRGLRVRTGHLGREVACKYCAHQFLLSPEPQCDPLALTEMDLPVCPGIRAAEGRPRTQVDLALEATQFDDDEPQPHPPAGGLQETWAYPTDERRPSQGPPTIEAERAERRAPRTRPEASPDRRAETDHAASGPASSGRPARPRRRARTSSLFAKVAAVCLLGGGVALYLKGPSRADYGRLYDVALAKANLLGPGDRGKIYGHSSPAVPTPGPSRRPEGRRAIICSGRVEPVRGEVDVSAQIEGQLAEVAVSEGDVVKQGDVLAVLEGPRETAELSVAEANVAIAKSRLKQVQAGNGPEEVQQALHEVEAQDALLAFEKRNLGRLYKLLQRRSLSLDDYERQQRKVEQLQRQRDGIWKHYEAVRRGPLPQEIEVARAELALAEQRLRRVRVEHDLRIIRAPMAGTILEVYRHAGDSVITDMPTPILRMADTSKLRIRLEIDEASVARLRPGMRGTLQIRGSSTDVGRVTVTTIVPMFGPKRLFNPDTSARFDTRTLAVFCEPSDSSLPLYPGQRVTASLADTSGRDAGRQEPGPPMARAE